MRAVIFANGIINPATPVREILNDEVLVIAADGGARHCLALRVNPAVVIGDFDSLSAADLEGLEAAGAEFIRHPERKDNTDLELALAHAAARGAEEIVILGGLGGRLDQTAASLLLLASPDGKAVRTRLIDGRQSAEILRGRGAITLQGQPGDTVSLLPMAGDAQGISTTGLEYPLQNEALSYGSTRGVSNLLLDTTAEVRLEKGLLLVVHIQGKIL